MEGRSDDRFPVISDGEREPPSWTETLFGDHPRWESGERGPRQGTVTITETDEGTFDAVFDFDGEEDVEYSGRTPPWDRPGRGEGRATKRRGPRPFRQELNLKWVNPKRWG